MELKERYLKKSALELIEILESSEEYTAESYTLAGQVLEERSISETEQHQLAIQVNTEKIRAVMIHLDPLNDELKIHKSTFLSKEEIKRIYLEQLEIFMKEKEGFRFDVWSYAIGAI